MMGIVSKSAKRVSLLVAAIVLALCLAGGGLLLSNSLSAKAAEVYVVPTIATNPTGLGGFEPLEDRTNVPNANNMDGEKITVSYYSVADLAFTLDWSLDLSSLTKEKAVMEYWLFVPENVTVVGDGTHISDNYFEQGASMLNTIKSNLCVGWNKIRMPFIANINGNTMSSATLGSWSRLVTFTGPATRLRYAGFGFRNATDEELEACADKAVIVEKQELYSISLDKTTLELTADNKEATLNATITAADGSDTKDMEVDWSVSPMGLVSVDANGKVTALGNTKDTPVTVTASVKGSPNIKATCTVTVTGLVNISNIAINGDKNIALSADNKTVQLSATAKDGEDDVQTAFSWSVSGDKAVTVDNNGLVTAIKTGTSTVTASVGDKSDSVTVTVTGMDFSVRPTMTDSANWGSGGFASEAKDFVPNGVSGKSYLLRGNNRDDSFVTPEFGSVDLSGMDLNKAVTEFWFYADKLSPKFHSFQIFSPNANIIANSSVGFGTISNDIAIGWNKIRIPFAIASGSNADYMDIFNDVSKIYFFAYNSDNVGGGLLVCDFVFREVNDGNYTNSSTAQIIEQQKIYTSVTVDSDTLALTYENPTGRVTGTGADGVLGTIRYRSENPSVVRVDAETGAVTAVGNSKTLVNVIAYVAENPTVTATCAVTSTGFVEIDRVAIDGEKERNITSKQVIQLTVKAFGPAPDNTEWEPERYVVAWSSSDENVGTVDEETGLVKIMRNGTFTVTANISGVTDSVTFTVTGISNKIDLEITGFSNWTVPLTDCKPNGFIKDVYDLSERVPMEGFAPKFVPVDLSEMWNNHTSLYLWVFMPDPVPQMSAGAGYNVSYQNGTTQVLINDVTKFTQLEYSPGWNLVRIPLGNISEVNFTEFWIMLVFNGNSNYSGMLMGTPWIDEGEEYGWAIVEKQSVYTEMSINKESVTLGKDSNETLVATGSGGDCGTFFFESSAPSIVTVDKTGKLTPIKNGTATITVYLGENKSVKKECAVTVSGMPEVKSITVTNGTEISLRVGQSHDITVAVTDADAVYTLKYDTSDRNVVRVSNGKVLAIAAGTATVTVSVEGTSFTATVSITVTESSGDETDPGNTDPGNTENPPAKKKKCGSFAGAESGMIILSLLALTGCTVLLTCKKKENR